MSKKKLATKKAGPPKFTVNEGGGVEGELTSKDGTVSVFGTHDSVVEKMPPQKAGKARDCRGIATL